MVRISQALLAGVLAVCLAATIAFVGGWRMSQSFSQGATAGLITPDTPSSPSSSSPDISGRTAPTGAVTSGDFGVYWEVWGLVQHEFYHKEPLDEQQMVYGSIRGMLQSLNDDYTGFQEPVAAERSRESMRGSFQGIGILMHIEDGEVIVALPLRKSPAKKAGLQANDVIVEVDGEAVAEMMAGLDENEALDAVSSKIRGPKGSTVVLTIRRPSGDDDDTADDEVFDVTIERDVVPLISVNYAMLDDSIAYIQITDFRSPTPEEFDEALRELLPQNPKGLILDVRHNPGGVLTAAQEVLGRFYEGAALYEEDSSGEYTEMPTMPGARDVQIEGIPLVVMINERAASASEIVAGALRERYPDTVLMGETTFGKGSVQNVHRLSDGSSARITVAHWFTPDKNEIEGVGISPDYVVLPSDAPEYGMPCFGDTLPREGMDNCPDGQLTWAVRFLADGELPPTPEPTPEPES